MHAAPRNILQTLYAQALSTPPEQRAAFLRAACGSDELHAEIQAMLTHREEALTVFGELVDALLPSVLCSLWDREPTRSGRESRDGRTIGRYRVQERLGAGNMGVVYKAEDLLLRRTVALKFLPEAARRDPAANRRFMAEARAASALDHPNICTIYEVGETTDRQRFIVMACYEGETLRQKIERGPLPPGHTRDYVVQVGRGLVKAHAHGIVHRDIKPANLFVTDDGIVKVLDFGIAKIAGGTELTGSGALPGTPAYMSPEQLRGEPIDHRTDLWSLGVVLYEALTGERPFSGDYAPAVHYAVLNQDPRPLTLLRGGVPAELEAVIRKCLQKNARHRYASAADLLADLQAPRRRPWRTIPRSWRRTVRPSAALPAMSVS